MQSKRWTASWGLVGVAALAAALTVGAPAPVGADQNEGPATAQRDLSVGNFYGCALTLSGALKCWGQNNATGALGAGDNNNRGDVAGEMGDALPAVDLGTGRTAVSVSAGQSHTCAVLDNASLKCWGFTVGGQIGLGVQDTRGDGPGEMGDNLPAVDLGAGRAAAAVSVGGTSTCALLDNAAVKCWGDNLNGQEGLGDTTRRGDDPGEMGDALPAVNLGTGRTATTISSGRSHVCAILDNGSVKCWGWNQYGQLGLGATDNRGDGAGEMGDNLPPVDLGTGRTAVAISSSFVNTCALLDNGRVKCWGFGGFAIPATGATDNRGDGPGEMGDALPYVDLGTGRTAVAISTGDNFACALLDNGRVKCWGSNNAGQLGLGDMDTRGDAPGEMGDALPYLDLGTGRTATAVAAGNSQACARLDDGSIKCWGNNQSGALGLGDSANRGDQPGEMGDALPSTTLVTPAPALTASLSVSPGSVPVGGTVDYSVTVQNTGNVGLTGFAVTPPSLDCPTLPSTLLPGASTVIACTYQPTVDDLGSFPLTASVDTAQTSPVATNTQNVTVTIPAGQGVLMGSVTAQGVGDPVSGAMVAALTSSDFSATGIDLTAADGSYRTLVPAGSYFVYTADPAGAHVAGFAALTTTTVADGATVTVNAQVSRRLGGVSGRINGASGSGLATGLALTVNAGTGQLDGGALTDGVGDYAVRDLRAGPHWVTLVDLAGGHAIRYHDGTPTPAATTAAGAARVDVVGDAVAAIGTSQLPAQTPPAGTTHLQGTVSDSGGPLAGVAVLALSSATFQYEAAAVTDVNGDYDIAVDPGSYVLGFADTAGVHAFEWFDDQPGSGLDSATPVTAAVGTPGVADATLDSSRGSLAGTVVDDGSGDPLADVWVFAIDQTGSVVGVARTAANGTYSMADVPASGVRVRFLELTGTHVAEYFNDVQGPGSGTLYASATVVVVPGASTVTVDASLAASN